MLPIELLREIASHWPARNGLPRTCRQLAYGNPGPSAYARAVTTSSPEYTLIRTMLPGTTDNSMLDGPCSISMKITMPNTTANKVELWYALDVLTSCRFLINGNHVSTLEVGNFIGRPFMVIRSGRTRLRPPMVSMTGRIGRMTIAVGQHTATVTVSSAVDNSSVTTTILAKYIGPTMSDLHEWYRENEQAILDVPGVRDIANTHNFTIRLPTEMMRALHEPLPVVRPL